MLEWFDDNPERYWWLVCLTTFGALFAMVRPLLRSEWRDSKRTDWRWGLVIAAMLLAGRWPSWFVTRQLDPDENQFIAGGIFRILSSQRRRFSSMPSDRSILALPPSPSSRRDLP